MKSGSGNVTVVLTEDTAAHGKVQLAAQRENIGTNQQNIAANKQQIDQKHQGNEENTESLYGVE